SSRRRHTRFSRDWSSDVCSSDLPQAESKVENPKNGANTHPCDFLSSEDASSLGFKREGIPSPDSPDELCIWETENGERSVSLGRSEERRVGKECRSRGCTDT